MSLIKKIGTYTIPLGFALGSFCLTGCENVQEESPVSPTFTEVERTSPDYNTENPVNGFVDYETTANSTVPYLPDNSVKDVETSETDYNRNELYTKIPNEK